FIVRPRPRSTLLPYPTLFLSGASAQRAPLAPFVERQLPVAPAVVPFDLPVRPGQLDDVSALHDVVVPARVGGADVDAAVADVRRDRKSTRLNSSHVKISYAVF